MKKLIKSIFYILIGIIFFYLLLFIFAGIKDTSKDGWSGDSELLTQDIPSPKLAEGD